MKFLNIDGVEVEAVRGDTLIDGQVVDFPDWVKGAMQFRVIVMARHAVQIHGARGVQFAGRADWIVEGPDRSIYPVQGSLFAGSHTVIE